MTITYSRFFLPIAVLLVTTAAYVNAEYEIYCPPLWQNCDRNDSNGCEVNVSYDDLNCGECEMSCYKSTERITPPWSRVYCTNGLCITECTHDHMDCDNNDKNGCEMDLTGVNESLCTNVCDLNSCSTPTHHDDDPLPPTIVVRADGTVVRGLPKLVGVVSLIAGLIILMQ